MPRGAILVAAAATAVGVLGGCGAEPAASTKIPATSTPPSAPATAATYSATSDPSAPPAPAEPATRTIRITMQDGQPSGDIGRVQVPLGSPVTLTITSDVADELHVHGYDKAARIPSGGTGSVDFVANIPGVFEVELHESGLQLLQLHVS